MNTFIKLIITYFIEQQLGVAHEAAVKVVGQIEMNYAFNKFQHDVCSEIRKQHY